MKLMLRNGRVIDPASGRDEIADVYIRDAFIEKIDAHLREKGSDIQTIDVAGHCVAPGLIDLHCHLREPGYEYKETIATGSRAATKGGFSTVVCMANTDPVNDNGSITSYIVRKARAEGACRVFPCGAITRGLNGGELSEIGEMCEAGIVALSDDGKSVRNAGLLRKALEYARLFSLPVISHCEDRDLATGYVNEGSASLLSGLEATPSIAEEVMVLRDMAVARYVGAPIHLTHISTAGSVEAIRAAKGSFSKITADTCPHYFHLTDEATLTFDTNAKVNPPLRSAHDVQAIRNGLRDGTIDIIATDHAPHELTSKDVEFNLATYGISGFETALALALGLVQEGILSLPDLIGKMSLNPARLLGLPFGEIGPGKAADLIVFNPDVQWVVDRADFLSKGRNTPFHGRTVRGRNLLTIVNGEIRYRHPSLLP